MVSGPQNFKKSVTEISKKFSSTLNYSFSETTQPFSLKFKPEADQVLYSTYIKNQNDYIDENLLQIVEF